MTKPRLVQGAVYKKGPSRSKASSPAEKDRLLSSLDCTVAHCFLLQDHTEGGENARGCWVRTWRRRRALPKNEISGIPSVLSPCKLAFGSEPEPNTHTHKSHHNLYHHLRPSKIP